MPAEVPPDQIPRIAGFQANAQIPVVGQEEPPALMHNAVFNMPPCGLRGRVPPGAFRDCLPAAAGHFSAGKEVGYYPTRLAT